MSGCRLVARQNSIGMKVIDYSAGSLQTSNHDRDIAMARNSDSGSCARAPRFGAENLALRQQLGVLKRRKRIPRLRRQDRWFWVCALSNLGSLAASLAPGQGGHRRGLATEGLQDLLGR